MRRGNFAFISAEPPPFSARMPAPLALWPAEERKIMATARQRSLGAQNSVMGQFWTWERHSGPCGSIAALFSDSIFSSSSVLLGAAAVFVFWDLANLLTNYEYYSCSNEVRKLLSSLAHLLGLLRSQFGVWIPFKMYLTAELECRNILTS